MLSKRQSYVAILGVFITVLTIHHAAAINTPPLPDIYPKPIQRLQPKPVAPKPVERKSVKQEPVKQEPVKQKMVLQANKHYIIKINQEIKYCRKQAKQPNQSFEVISDCYQKALEKLSKETIFNISDEQVHSNLSR
ncbi:hypothetical protein ACQZV8_00425 [Magnetococcales bacterium HHB-1]